MESIAKPSHRSPWLPMSSSCQSAGECYPISPLHLNLLDEEHLKRIRQPVQIIVEDQDNTVTIRESTHSEKSLPHAQAQILTDTPHPFEKVPPAHLAQSLIEFFS